MKNLLSKAKTGVIVMVALMLLTVPNLRVFSAVGSYSENSSSLLANNNGVKVEANSEAAWLAAAAGAIGVAYAAGYALGTLAHHAYDLLGGHPEEKIAFANVDYDSNDFSKFDN